MKSEKRISGSALIPKLAYSIGDSLILAVSLLVFSYFLLGSLDNYFFRTYTAVILFLGVVLYGLSIFVFLLLVKSKIWLTIFLWSIFILVFLILGYQIAFDSRSEFGATWLGSEVFWELFVQKGKGIYILIATLLIKLLIFTFLSKSKYEA